MTTELHASGVDYRNLDAHKKGAQAQAAETALSAVNFDKLGWEVLEWTRGESVFLVRHTLTGLILGFLVEGLGTKNLIAENAALREFCQTTFYDVMGWDCVAIVFNDAITLGAIPLVYAQHPAVAAGDHLNGANGEDLIRGTVEAVKFSGAIYGPGETPGLAGIIVPGTMCLSGAGLAHVPHEKDLINPANLRPGQKIVMLESNGIHANGISAIRKRVTEVMDDDYVTFFPSGPTGQCLFGGMLMQKTQIYVPFMRECQKHGVRIAYAVHISGHGWAKVQRAKEDFTYFIDTVPEPSPTFGFIQKLLGHTSRQMYGAYNMGQGFCLMVEESEIPLLYTIGQRLDMLVTVVGTVQEGPRRVIIKPLDIEFTPEDVDVR
jgi:phosphoribosylformylglycinamidine cyclo-ligase